MSQKSRNIERSRSKGVYRGGARGQYPPLEFRAITHMNERRALLSIDYMRTPTHFAHNRNFYKSLLKGKLLYVYLNIFWTFVLFSSHRI